MTKARSPFGAGLGIHSVQASESHPWWLALHAFFGTVTAFAV